GLWRKHAAAALAGRRRRHRAPRARPQRGRSAADLLVARVRVRAPAGPPSGSVVFLLVAVQRTCPARMRPVRDRGLPVAGGRLTRRLILLIVVAAVACGPTQAQPPVSPTPVVATPSISPTATSSTSVFAALQADSSGNPEQWNAVAMVRFDGSTQAKAGFVPMPLVDAGCIAAILPPSAHVAAGKVYFADGKGEVRSLATDGQVSQVATLPFTGNQQMLSFAV